jgi:hypothetical protein
MLPSAHQKGGGVCPGTSKWIPSGTSAAKAVIVFAAFIAALKRCAAHKQSATRRFTENFAELLPRIFIQAATEKQIPQQLAP